jgi:hypothetical protein
MRGWQEKIVSLWDCVIHYWKVLVAVITLVILIAGTVVATLSYQHMVDNDRVDALEQLVTLMWEIRAKYETYCVRGSESLRQFPQDRYDRLVKISAVDPSVPPYDLPCRQIRIPGSITGLTVTVSPSKYASQYDDWISFMNHEKKTAVLWIGGIPTMVDVSTDDWKSRELAYNAMMKQAEDCTKSARAKAEHAFVQLECQWAFGDENVPHLELVESRGSSFSIEPVN